MVMESGNNIIDKLEELFSDLLVILESNSNNDIEYQISMVRYIIRLLKQCINNHYLDSNNVINEIRSLHKKIYPPRGGLSDFFIWREDFNERVKANEPLEKIGNELWMILQ